MSLDELARTLRALPSPPKDVGRLERIIVRPARGERASLEAAQVSCAGGVEGDRWAERSALLGERVADRQVTMIRADVATTLTAPQDAMWTGDNLHILLDLSEENLPAGSRLRIGESVVLELTARRHTSCRRFRERFGDAAASINGEPSLRSWRLRGALLRVRQGGRVQVGDSVRVEYRGNMTGI
jgi:MOSC domain-containing protein YiiM